MPKECPNCGGTPMGEACSHQCFNSPHYYSPEQERADEPFYGDDDINERYMEHCPRHGAYAGDCGGCEAEYNAQQDSIMDGVTEADFIPATSANDDFDLPF